MNLGALHLNAVAYGWTPKAGIGTALFVIPRLLKTELGTRRSTTGAAQRSLPEDSTSISCAYFGSGSLARPPSSTSSNAISLAGLVALAFFETRCGTRGASYQDCPTE
jgi:hypothetical protein